MPLSVTTPFGTGSVASAVFAAVRAAATGGRALAAAVAVPDVGTGFAESNFASAASTPWRSELDG
jgi:hypothetical protein